MESASFESLSSRASFLPPSPLPTPPTQPQESQSTHRPKSTWWERLLLVLMRILWLAGMVFGSVIVVALPPAQKPHPWQVCFFTAALTALVAGLHWCVLFVIRGDDSAQDPKSKYARWAFAVVLFVVFAWFAKTDGFSNLVTTSKTQQPEPYQAKPVNDEDNITFDDLIPKNHPRPTP